MKIQTKIIYNQRKWILNIPSLIMKGLNWRDDVVNIKLNPENNTIEIENILTKPVGFLGLHLNIGNAKYEKNKKKFQQALYKDITKEGRKVLYDTKWEEVDDGGYHLVALHLNYSKFYKEFSKKQKNNKMNIIEKVLSQKHEEYAIEIKKELEKRKAKKPAWFSKMNKEINKIEMKLSKRKINKFKKPRMLLNL